MKTTTRIAALLLTLLFALTGCKKDPVTGPQGPQGPPGNANEYIVDFTIKDNEWSKVGTQYTYQKQVFLEKEGSVSAFYLSSNNFPADEYALPYTLPASGTILSFQFYTNYSYYVVTISYYLPGGNAAAPTGDTRIKLYLFPKS